MKARLFVLPALCLGGATLILAPSQPSLAFSKIGGSLGVGQRDVRLFNNFADVTANNNNIPDTQFPGWLGANLAIWKAIVEWGSQLHGDGTGDPLNNPLGDGGANFDAFWSGSATNIGNTNHNIVSAISTCSSGVLAFTETPISDGWRIRFCESWVWDDGPGNISNRWDIQSVMAHEYGHALGLGHSAISAATMAPSGSPGQTGLRSIHPDDIAGIQCVYGLAAGSKPSIVATVASAGMLTIYGNNFDATNNEVWFCPSAQTLPADDPIVRVSAVASLGGQSLTVAIPAAAGPGDVIVKLPGTAHSSVSNAFPTDLVGTFGNPPVLAPDITSVNPPVFDALLPGTTQAIFINGTGLTLTTDLLLDGVPIDPSRYTIFDSTTITLDMPQASSLGAHTISATDGVNTDDFPVTIVAPSIPRYQMGSGDFMNVVDRDNGLPLIISGNPGSSHYVYFSTSSVPSSNAFVSFDMGNNFTNLVLAGHFTIPAKGWLQLNIGTNSLPNPGVGGMVFYSQTFALEGPAPFPVSNIQSMLLVQ